jgi:hypothetical protein
MCEIIPSTQDMIRPGQAAHIKKIRNPLKFHPRTLKWKDQAYIRILSSVGPLLGNDREISSYTTGVSK